jgi:bifunctional oligoribonuclease and PAP phosphatase NrnA
VKSVVSTLKKAKSILIVTHRRPDGDALGSALALGISLVSLGKKVSYYDADPVPKNLTFLQDSQKFQQTLKSDQYDVACIVDCPSPARVGEDFEAFKGYQTLVVIDHHQVLGQSYGDVRFIDPTAAACSVLIYQVIKALKAKMTPDIAEALYCALMMDTGSFCYPNTDESVLKMARELVKSGAEPSKVAEHLFEGYPVARLRLLALTLSSLEISDNGHYASVTVTQDMLLQTQGDEEMIEGFVQFPRSINSVQVALQFKEVNPECCRISLRSKGLVNVAQIADQFGGGGHRNAAGLEIKGSVAEAKQKLYAVLDQYLKEAD